jgi:thiamine monophosphate kinase
MLRADDLDVICRTAWRGPRACVRAAVSRRVVVSAVVAEPLSSGAAMLEVDAAALALAGGEDYELLATLPADAVERAREELRSGFGVDLSEIGEIVAGPGLVAVDADGATAPLEPAGWDHFAHG